MGNTQSSPKPPPPKPENQTQALPPHRRTALPKELQAVLDDEEKMWVAMQQEGIPETDTTDTPLRYAAYASRVRTILLAAHRYIAYTSDIGESFRPVAHPYLVRSAYAVSWAYLIGDVGYEGYKAWLKNQRVLNPERFLDVHVGQVGSTGMGVYPIEKKMREEKDKVVDEVERIKEKLGVELQKAKQSSWTDWLYFWKSSNTDQSHPSAPDSSSNSSFVGSTSSSPSSPSPPSVNSAPSSVTTLLHPSHPPTIHPLEDYRTVMAQRAIFQSVASMGLPAFTIHSIVRYSGQMLKTSKAVKSAKVRTWAPIGLGLAAIPFLPFVFDEPVERAVEWMFGKGSEMLGYGLPPGWGSHGHGGAGVIGPGGSGANPASSSPSSPPSSLISRSIWPTFPTSSFVFSSPLSLSLPNAASIFSSPVLSRLMSHQHQGMLSTAL